MFACVRTLTNCALLSETELFSKIAEVRLGIVLGFLENVDGESFDDFYNDMHPTTFRISNGLEGMSERKCDEVRAETVCKVLPQIVQVVGRKK